MSQNTVLTLGILQRPNYCKLQELSTQVVLVRQTHVVVAEKDNQEISILYHINHTVNAQER